MHAVDHGVTRQNPLCPDRCEERLDADDVDHPRRIVGTHGECHLAGDLRQCLRQEVVALTRALIVPNGCSTVSRR
jgi:hypothetical protein